MLPLTREPESYSGQPIKGRKCRIYRNSHDQVLESVLISISEGYQLRMLQGHIQPTKWTLNPGTVDTLWGTLGQANVRPGRDT